MAGGVIDPLYLPFSEQDLLQHFILKTEPGRYTSYYVKSAERYARLRDKCRQGLSVTDMKHDCQIEKDERFWIAGCLLRYYHRPGRVAAISALLTRCFGPVPPVPGLTSWGECLSEDEDNLLYFEVNVPAPEEYVAWLKEHVGERQIVPYILDAARSAGGGYRGDLEGPTHVDAVLLNRATGFAVFFEAKVLSDISVGVTFDPLRNQLARIVDVMLEPNERMGVPLSYRDPRRTLLVLVTPELFRRAPHARLYGWLMQEYRSSPSALARDLPHRKDVDFAEVSRRLGWVTWEECDEVLPGACPWLRC